MRRHRHPWRWLLPTRQREVIAVEAAAIQQAEHEAAVNRLIELARQGVR